MCGASSGNAVAGSEGVNAVEAAVAAGAGFEVMMEVIVDERNDRYRGVV